MSEHNRATDPPEERGSVVPTDVESAGAHDGIPEGAPDDAANVEVARDEGPVRRSLIRATLKHPEGTPPPPREAPVFTMHEQPRGGASSSRGPSRGGGRPARDGHPNKKKNSRERTDQYASKGNSTGGKKRSSRPDRGGQDRLGTGRPRRDKGRSR